MSATKILPEAIGRMAKAMIVNCPSCGYPLIFTEEKNAAAYQRSCHVCKATVQVSIDIVEPSTLSAEDLKHKRNQHRG